MGIGFFNAITERTEATIRNRVTGETRQQVTEPFANYNVFVLDQTFNQNSAITLTNTNVTRDGSFRDGNVTGISYHVRTKNSKYFPSVNFFCMKFLETFLTKINLNSISKIDFLTIYIRKSR